MSKWTLARDAAVCCLAVAALPAAAQDMKAERTENVRYKTVEMVKFKPGSGDRAFAIIKDHFVPSAKAAGIPMPVTLHPQSGEWDEITIFPLSGGIEDLGYSTTPDEAKWLNALTKQQGSKEKAMALVAEYNGLVERRDRIIVHEHTQ
ncbi:hypothetical protein [Sphingomonas japonica]|uniref:NIPSNAP protein n=1 Tax=Sphingomonas japonica TaxID=511662 RepID=A0ABX0U7D9_9SPHN|nr:hypothetical protein [Sphingomonas japonica]NIJ24692.1 hypothetical protein [Sphingomonas japonica]